MYRIFKRWQAVNQQWKVLNYEKSKDLGDPLSSSSKAGSRGSRSHPHGLASGSRGGQRVRRLRTILNHHCGYTILHILSQLRPSDTRLGTATNREVVMRVTTVWGKRSEDTFFCLFLQKTALRCQDDRDDHDFPCVTTFSTDRNAHEQCVGHWHQSFLEFLLARLSHDLAHYCIFKFNFLAGVVFLSIRFLKCFDFLRENGTWSDTDVWCIWWLIWTYCCKWCLRMLLTQQESQP